MKVLLTGAAGNIGQVSLQALIDQGHQVRALFQAHEQAHIRRYANHPNVEPFVGDVRDLDRMQAAVAGQDAIIHLAYVIPPTSIDHPELATAVNLNGTTNLLNAAKAQSSPPRFYFASSLDVFGHTQNQEPPRRVSDPVQATDLYTEHKIQSEQDVKESGLAWCILRFADVPLLNFRSPHPVMFEIPLDQRFHVIHPLDVALAVANALSCEACMGRILLIGGGDGCQITYRDYLYGMLDAMGLNVTLPDAAFTTGLYCTDWMDTSESQALLHYQRYTFEDVLCDLKAKVGFRRYFYRLVSPVARRSMLRLSPYL